MRNEGYLNIIIIYEIGVEKAVISLILLCMSIFIDTTKIKNKTLESLKKINILIFSIALFLSLFAASLIIADAIIGPGVIDFNSNGMAIVRSITAPNSVILLVGIILLSYIWSKLNFNKIRIFYTVIVVVSLYPFCEVILWNFSFMWLEMNLDLSYLSMIFLALMGLVFLILPIKIRKKEKKKMKRKLDCYFYFEFSY